MKKIRIPREDKSDLSPESNYILQYLSAKSVNGFVTGGCAGSKMFPKATKLAMKDLAKRRVILVNSDKLAVRSLLKRALDLERSRNLMQKKRGKIADAWPVRDAALEAFPELSAEMLRPVSYNLPRAFIPILERFQHCHITQRPPSIVVLTDVFTSMEVADLLTFIRKRQELGQPVYLLYTRKGIYVGASKGSV